MRIEQAYRIIQTDYKTSTESKEDSKPLEDSYETSLRGLYQIKVTPQHLFLIDGFYLTQEEIDFLEKELKSKG